MKASTHLPHPLLTFAFKPFHSYLGKFLGRGCPSIPEISAADLRDLLHSNPQQLLLVDVRSPREYEAGHLPEAILVPLLEIEQGTGIQRIWRTLTDRWQVGLKTDPRLVVICTAGVRSARAVELLTRAGLSSMNLAGGIQAFDSLTSVSIPVKPERKPQPHSVLQTQS